MAVPVFVLQAFAVERCSASGTAYHEAPCSHVSGCPGKITDPLKPEHGVVNKERNHIDAMSTVGRGSGDPRRHAARLCDAFFQNLAGFVFFIKHNLIAVFWRV